MPGGRNQHGKGSRGSRPGRGRGSQRGRGVVGAGTDTGEKGRGHGGYHTLNDMGEVFLMSGNEDYRSGATSPRGRGRGQRSRPNSGFSTPRGRGRGGSSYYQSPRGRGRGGIGDYYSQTRGNFRGRGGYSSRPDASLSDLLYNDRPLLRPVVFVPSVNTKILFQEKEEILQATIEEVDEEEKSPIPTADRVSRIFSGGFLPHPPVVSSASEDDRDDDELIEIDYNDLDKILETPARPVHARVKDMEERFTGISLKQKSIPVSASSPMESEVIGDRPAVKSSQTLVVTSTSQLTIDSSNTHKTEPDFIVPSRGASDAPSADDFASFYIDTNPSPVGIEEHHQMGERAVSDEEVIVYVAPHPRIGAVTSAIPSSPPTPDPPISLPYISVLAGTSTSPSATHDPPTTTTTLLSEKSNTISPTLTPFGPAPDFKTVSFSFSPSPTKSTRKFHAKSKNRAALKQRRYEARISRQRREGLGGFGSLGAMVSEAQLQEGRDPRWEERRHGDSDLDWGDEDGGGGGGGGGDRERRDGVAEGMELDPDLLGEDDVSAMQRFVDGMVGKDGGRFVTMDDIEDIERMQDEGQAREGEGRESSEADEETTTSGDDDDDDDEEVEKIIHAEEEVLIAEPGDVDILYETADESYDDEEDEDEGTSPRASFQARLERLRNHSHTNGKGKGKRQSKKTKSGSKRVAIDEMDEDDDSEDEENYVKRSWADEDEDFIQEIQAILDENEDVLMGRDRKAKNKLFRAIHNGTFEDLEKFKPARKSKDKYKDLPEELQTQWLKDREKKAENKRARAKALMEVASDPLAYHKGGKKGRKAMLAAASFKSKSDEADAMFQNRVIDMTTLVQQIRRFLFDEGGPQTMALPPMAKHARKDVHEISLAFGLKSISKGKGSGRYTTLIKTQGQGGRGGRVNEAKVAKIMRRNGRSLAVGGGSAGANYLQKMPRHKEGEEVGKAAPKIGESNIGFRMLTLMGWSEGQRIGGDGLDAPLTAVIKNTKLGLGATK